MIPARIWPLALLVVPGAALAEPKNGCTSDYVAVQRLRKANQLVAARQRVLACADQVCPAFIQKDCVLWASELDTSIPTVVFAVRQPNGRDLVNVRVLEDDRLLTSKLDGVPIPIDPGVKQLRFEAEGWPILDHTVVVRTGEKNRTIQVSFEEPSSAPGHNNDSDRSVPSLVYVLGGVSAASWIGFTYLALDFDAQANDLERCRPNCPQQQVDDASSTRQWSYLPLGVGLLTAGAAAYLYLTLPASPTARVVSPIEVMVTDNGAHAAFRTSF